MANFLKSLFVKGVEIDTASATAGKVLTYDGTKFAPATPGTGSLALDNLSDVVITTPYKYQSLIYDGTNWINDDASTITYVSNAESTTLNVGEVVYLYQQQGDRASVKRAINTGDSTSAKTLGVVAASIAANASGPVVTQGYVTGCTLGSFTAGQTVYLSASAGEITSTKPYAPNHLVYIGVVVRANNGNGILYVRAQNGYELDEIHDVDLTTTPPTSGQYLRFGGTVWTADTIDLGTDTNGNYMSGISGTSPVSVTHTPAEGSSATVALASGYGDTQNPYASKTANYVLAAPNGTAGVPTFREIVAADIPTLNQNTTGSAAKWTTARTVTLAGDLTGSVSIDGSANATLTATIAADSVALGTDTTGNYMSGVTAGTGISVTHTPAEGSSASIAVDTSYSGFAPIGAVTMYSGSTAPTNWAICNGSELAIASYGPLYAIIGTRYGALTNGSGGVGTTHFKLPAFTSRVPKGTVSTPTVPTTTTASASSAVDVHTHGVNSTLTAGSVNSTLTAGSVNSSFTAGNATAHAHGVSINTGNESNYHYHFWSAAGVNTGNESAGHSHSYFKANSGANNNTGGVNASHYHAWSLYNQGNTQQKDANNVGDQLHTHLVSGNAAANTTTTVNSSFTAGNVNSTLTAGNVNSTLTAGNATTINASTPAHTHTVDSVDIVFIIRVA